MIIAKRKSNKISTRALLTLVVAACLAMGSATAGADEADAKRLLKAMSDYMAAQKAFSFDYDSVLDVVTTEGQVLGLASSGSLTAALPDKLKSTRSGGFVDVDSFFDGETLTILGKNKNIYIQAEIPGTIDNLINELKDTYNRPLPAADLLLSNSYDVLMKDVVEVRDLGSGVIGGVECNSLAFRTEQVDWQIWIAQGDEPYPCRYVITSKQQTNAPQYSVQLRNWKAGNKVAASGFSFKNTSGAEKVDLEQLKGMGDLPEIYVIEEGDSE